MSEKECEDRYERLARILGLVSFKPKKEAKEEEETVEEGELISLDELVTPAQAKIGDIILVIREIHKVKFPFRTEYIVTCQIKDANWLSHAFQLYVKNAEELREKVKVEIQRYLQHKVELGVEVARRI